MRKSEIISLIKRPELVSKDHIQGLQEILSSYPFFSSAQLLLTKAYKESENLNFEKQLRLNAAYAGDRRRLHELILNQNKVSDHPIAETDAVEAKENTVIEEGENEPIADIAEGESSHTEVQNMNEEDAFLESQILTSAINSSILQEVGDDQEGIESTAQEIADLASEEDKVSPSFNEAESHSFSAWIQHYNKEESTNSSVNAQSDAIKAISEQAKNIQKKAEFYSAAKMAKLSVIESDDLVTETLAQVYEAQGKYERALQAYQKLQLKFPEKRVYFAGRIKAVEEKLKA